MSKTITRLFDDYTDASAAVRDLEAAGIPRDDISIVANNTHGEHDGINDDGDVTKGASTGAAIGGVGGLLAGLGLLAIPGLGPIVAAGWLAATAVGAGIGAVGGAATGGIVGALKASGHSEEEANVYSEGVRRGGTLISVRADDAEAVSAEAILDRNRSVDAATRGAAYRQAGWTRFDADADAYTPEQVAADRAAYRTPVSSI